jgi:nicotinamide-nucleotide adenylyltransferase
MTPPIASAISSAIERVQQRVVSAALVYTSHERWPLSPTHSLPKITPAHQRFGLILQSSDSRSSCPRERSKSFSPASDYDAKLLLLSVRNADKLLQEGDATLSQRVEMMSLLATRIHHNNPSSPPNVAVGLVNEPTFIAKSSALRRFLDDRLAELTSNPSFLYPLSSHS